MCLTKPILSLQLILYSLSWPGLAFNNLDQAVTRLLTNKFPSLANDLGDEKCVNGGLSCAVRQFAMVSSLITQWLGDDEAAADRKSVVWASDDFSGA